VPFERNACFTGRESELARLEGKLFAEDRTTKIAITGLGGVGKTNLLIELVHRTREKHKNCSIIWLPATNMGGLQKAYREVAQQLEIPGWKDKKENIARLVQLYLSKESAGQWLLVFDNADDINMWIDTPGSEQKSDSLIDYLPKSRQGCIVFTTRNMNAAVDLAQQNIVEMSEMSEGVAMQMLQNYLINKDLINNARDAKALLAQLTYLPLAISQAAAYINKTRQTLAKYLALLAEQEGDVVELLSMNFEDEGRYRDVKNPIATTFLISFEHIRRQDSLAAGYLSFVACVDPKDVPLSLLPPGPSRNKETIAIGTLKAYSFISMRSAEEAFDVHRLVHLAIRNWLRKEKRLAQWSEKAIARLADVFPDFDNEYRSLWRGYLVHAHYVLKSNLIEKCGEARISLACKFGLCLYSDGRYNEAEELFLQVMETRKRVLGEEHRSTLTSIGNLAAIYRNQGRWKEAEERLVQVIEIKKRVLGEEDPSTLISMTNLAATYKDRGQWKDAEELLVLEIEIRKRVLGEEDPSTLTSMAILAATYSSQGRLKEAEELIVQVIETWKRVVGEEHPSTLTSMANLASTYKNQGRWKEAEELLVQVIEVRKRVLRKEHPDTLTSMNCLALTWKGYGRHAEALKLMKECVLLQTRILGFNHPNTLDSRTALVKWQTEILEASTSAEKDLAV
jgi:tetratricopeptide (TPR) repeat protein